MSPSAQDVGGEPAHEPEVEIPTRPVRTDEDLLELCRLLIGLERADLQEALERLRDRHKFTEHLSTVLADAMRIGQARDRRFAEALAPVIANGVHETVKRDASEFGRALAPAMGPAIRQSVLLMIRGLVQGFERMLAQRMSARSLKWRYEAWRTGRSFAEVVFLHTLVYRVEHVFLIQRETGLLLTHASAPDVQVSDPDLVSAMLTAIQDFVGDAFAAPEGETLGEFQVGELNVLVETGDDVVLAAVVRGVGPQEVRVTLREILEQVQLESAPALAAFDGDVTEFAATEPLLTTCMVRQELEPRRRTLGSAITGKRLSWMFGILLAVVLTWIGVGWHFSSKQMARWDGYVAALRAEAGLIVTSHGWERDRYVIAGIRDPLARDPAAVAQARGITAEEVDERWHTADTRTPTFVNRRLAAVLEPPEGVSLRLMDGVLAIDGSVGHAWIARCRRLATLVAGVDRLDLKGLRDEDFSGYSAAIKALRAERPGLGSGQLQPADVERIVATVRRLGRHGRELSRRASIEATVLVPPGASKRFAATPRRLLDQLRPLDAREGVEFRLHPDPREDGAVDHARLMFVVVDRKLR